MKKIFLACCALASACLFAAVPSGDSAKEKAARCYGKIRIVSSSFDPDFKVSKALNSSLATLRVERVTHRESANAPGKWYILSDTSPLKEDFRVAFVSIAEDFSVAFVDNFPGVN